MGGTSIGLHQLVLHAFGFIRYFCHQYRECKDLYALYYNQFFVACYQKLRSSIGSAFLYPARPDLYYYITYYDSSVFKNISIDANGVVMTYDIIGTSSDCSYINIIFVL